MDVPRILAQLEAEIAKYQARIEAIRPLVDSDGYRKSVDLNQCLADTQSKLSDIKEPSPAAVFLVRTILESLCEGSMTEKELKGCLVDACRDIGVKSTGRGTVAGLNIDVSTTCAVLSAIGILDADTNNFSRVVGHEELAAFRQTLQLTGVVQSGNVAAAAAAAAAATAAAGNEVASAIEYSDASSELQTNNGQGHSTVGNGRLSSDSCNQRLSELRARASGYGLKSQSGPLTAEEYREILQLETQLLPESSGCSLLFSMILRWSQQLGVLYEEARRIQRWTALEAEQLRVKQALSGATRIEAAASTAATSGISGPVVAELESVAFVLEGAEARTERAEPAEAELVGSEGGVGGDMDQSLNSSIDMADAIEEVVDGKGEVELEEKSATASELEIVLAGQNGTIAATKQPTDANMELDGTVVGTVSSSGAGLVAGPDTMNLRRFAAGGQTDGAGEAAESRKRKKSVGAKDDRRSVASGAEVVVDPATGLRVSRRSPHQKAWRLDDKSQFQETLSCASKSLLEWAVACFEESVALEKEEALLRRLAGQCNLQLSSKPYRLGTRYLSGAGRGSGDGVSANSPSTLREGVHFTAAMLWEKARKNYKRQRAHMPYPPPKPTMPVVHPGPYFCKYIGVPNAGEREETDRQPSKKGKARAAAAVGAVGGEAGIGEVSRPQQTIYTPGFVNPRFAVPWVAHLDYITRLNPSMQLEDTLYASYMANNAPSQSSLTATVFIEDLAIKTADVPWKLISAEFVHLDADDPEFSFNGDITLSPRAAVGVGRSKFTRDGKAVVSPRLSMQSIRASLSNGDLERLAEQGNSSTIAGSPRCDQLQSSPRASAEGSEGYAQHEWLDEKSMGSERGEASFADLVAPPFVLAPWDLDAEVAAYRARDPKNDSDDSGEDTSDETVNARHEETLRRMRDRIALIAQLKKECKELGAAAGGSGSHGRPHSPRASGGGTKRRGYSGARKGNIDNLRRARAAAMASGAMVAGVGNASMDVDGDVEEDGGDGGSGENEY